MRPSRAKHLALGDDWAHDVQLNDVVDHADSFHRRLTGGEHAFPPDDCGGVGGYEAIQAALRTGRDPEELLVWAKEVWGWTGRFDLEATRQRFDMGATRPRRTTKKPRRP